MSIYNLDELEIAIKKEEKKREEYKKVFKNLIIQAINQTLVNFKLNGYLNPVTVELTNKICDLRDYMKNLIIELNDQLNIHKIKIASWYKSIYSEDLYITLQNTE